LRKSSDPIREEIHKHLDVSMLRKRKSRFLRDGAGDMWLVVGNSHDTEGDDVPPKSTSHRAPRAEGSLPLGYSLGFCDLQFRRNGMAGGGQFRVSSREWAPGGVSIEGSISTRWSEFESIS
jgi:hypothetical protein